MYENDSQKELITVKVDVSGLAEKLNALEQVGNCLLEAVGQALGERFSALKAELATRNEQVLDSKLSALRTEIANNQNSHHGDLAATLGAVQAAIEDMKGKLRDKAAYDAELHAQEQSHNDALRAKEQEYQTALQHQREEHATELEKKKSEYTETVSQLRAEKDQVIQGLKEELTTLQSSQNDMEPLRVELAEKQDALAAWEAFAKPYGDVQQAMEACPSLNAFREEHSLRETFDYIRAFGSTLDFAISLFDFMAQLKGQTKDVVTSEEHAVYAAVNACYRTTCRIGHDVFGEPDSVYDKTKVEDLEYPKERWTKVECVYVPVLYSLDENEGAAPNVYKLGKVRGKN